MIHRILLVLISLVLLALLGSTLGGCNTVKGAGEDLKNLGEAGEQVIMGEDGDADDAGQDADG